MTHHTKGLPEFILKCCRTNSLVLRPKLILWSQLPKNFIVSFLGLDFYSHSCSNEKSTNCWVKSNCSNVKQYNFICHPRYIHITSETLPWLIHGKNKNSRFATKKVFISSKATICNFALFLTDNLVVCR